MNIIEILISLNNRGIFPGPNEQEDHFFKRALAPKSIIAPENLKTVQDIFDASPDWVKIEEKSKGLLPWEGAASWIEDHGNGTRSASIQIKSSFLTRLYPKEELLSHELVHAMRLMFEESRFEEILAYRTSKNRFRRFFGPLFSRPRETTAFVTWTFFSWLLYYSETLFDFAFGGEYLIWSPLVGLSWMVWRLARSQRLFSSALKRLEKTIREPRRALAVALRLSDREIEQFAHFSPDEIRGFAAREKDRSFRWDQLYSIYF
jgi:hypothetical protein